LLETHLTREEAIKAVMGNDHRVRCARRMLRSSEAGIDIVEKASGASEEARLCCTDGGAAEDRRECAFTPS
jgi:hypothetical protein